jgi:3-phenylpropionate/trans-cinnamate dioxygenase ferredoxin subunit
MEVEFSAVAAAGDIARDSCKPFQVQGLRIVVAHLADGWHAVENRCSHANSVLNTSKIYRGCQIACPVHGARFDLRTGAAKSPPAFTPLAVYPIRIRDGMVEVAAPRPEAPLRSAPR